MFSQRPIHPRSLTLLLVIVSSIIGQVGLTQERVEEIVVIGRQEFLATEFTAKRTGSAADAARLMSQVPGGAAASNGPLTGQIQYRGMSGPRINVRVDGMLINGGGPNWMAPPLHHIPAGLMEELVIEQGIPSISTGGGIGGAATAYWKRPDYFNGNGWKLDGDMEGALSSVDDGTSVSGLLGLSSENHRIYLVGAVDEGDDYQSAQGKVAATQYQRDAYGVGYGFKSGVHELDIDYRRIETDDTGTPSLPMDIDWFDTELWNAAYRTQVGEVGLELRVYGSEIDHGMSNSLLRPAPDFSSLTLPPFVGDDKRRVLADSEESGFKLTLDWGIADGSFIAGLEGKNAKHNATVSDPDFAPFFVNNFADSEVEKLALFGQWSTLIGNSWYLEAGARVEKVDTDSGEVDAFPARLVDANPAMWPMGTPPRAVFMLREAFNNTDRSQSDTNVDWVLKARYQATEALVVELGLAQKARSPMYQERYLWIPLEANAGLGDGNNYVGNPQLDPEKSQQIELGLDWNYGNFYISPRFYYRQVDDYIQGVAATDMAVIGVSSNANGDPTPLMFANTDADFWGVDTSFGVELGNDWRIDGIASKVNGERGDINDNIYRVAPDTLRVTATYQRNDINLRLEQVLVAEQDKLSAANTLDPLNANNSYLPTDSYKLTNIYLDWFANSNLTLTAGIENLFDEDYTDHLTGFNRVIASVVPVGSRMFGPGQNFFARVQYQW